MKPLSALNQYRDRLFEERAMGSSGGLINGHPMDDYVGAFSMRCDRGKQVLRIMASRWREWDDSAFNHPWNHVSVSLKHRCPSWDEMSWVKDQFFEPDETVMQLHVPSEDHVNNHQFCLHLWQPALVEIPRPPSIMVGVRDLGTVK